MQLFVAVLSNLIDQSEFEKSWRLHCAGMQDAGVTFAGKRITLTLEPGPEGRWQTEIVHRKLSDAVRRVDQLCNIRWI
jgi:hypothetical protein